MDRHRTEPTGTERAGKIVPVVSIACFIVPGLVWAGWHFDVAVLKSVIPGLTAMNPVTALCFLLCGISLWMLMKPISSRKVRLIASVLVLAVFLVAAQRLAAYIFDWGWSVDRLFFRAKLDLSRIPNRMAPNTAALFLLVSVSLLAINSCRRKAIVVAQVLGALIGLTGIFALVGYLFDAMVAAQMKGFNAMAIPTASLMVLLGAAVALIRPNQGPVTVFTNERLAGKVARSLLAFSVIGPLVLGYLRLQGQWRDYYATEFGTALYATSMVAMFGFVIWLTARSVDRSDVRRAEAVEATDNEREFTRQVVDAVPSFIFVKDRAGKFKFANRAVAEAYGTSPDRLLGKTDADFSSNSEEIEAFRARDLQVIESQRELTYTEPMTDASGQIRWLYTIKRPITHPNGELTDGVLGISLDVTDRNRLMDALQGSEERTNSILSSIDEVIFSTSADRSELLFINEAAARMFGHPIDDLMRDRQLIREKFLPEDALIEQEGMELAAAGHAADFEFRIVGTDGEIRWLNTRARRVDAEDGTPLRIDGTTRDVTEQKRFQEELSRAKDEADRANSAKSEFLSRMSHELRTPLNSILGFAQLLEMDEPTQKQFEAVNYILSAGRHLLALVNDVLDIARVETGNLAISLEPVDVAVAIREAVALAEPVARGRSVQLTADFDGLEGMHIMADRHRFAQVLLNLLSNAVKYNTEGGSVSISTYPGGEGRIQIEVADTGPGIPIEMMDRLFRPFERLGAETGKVEGAGLGLALSRALVEAMHGTISVDAARKQGCAFTIELQIVDSPGAALEPQDLISTIPAARSDDASTVLYIEDNPSNIRLMEHIFADWTHARLLVAMQGRIGLELAREHNPDVVLLDLHLPDIPGNEVLAEMKADEQLQGIPVIVISADATQDRVKALLAAGAMKYITKPLQVKELIEALDEVLRMKERANAA